MAGSEDDVTIDVMFVPRVARSVVDAELDGRLVLYDTATTALLSLDEIASAVWCCVDGTSSIATIATDLADSFRAPRSLVLADLVELVQMLVGEGFVVARADRAGPDEG